MVKLDRHGAKQKIEIEYVDKQQDVEMQNDPQQREGVDSILDQTDNDGESNSKS